MYVQPSINVAPGQGAASVSFPETSGGTSPGAGEGIRADWQVRLNVSHAHGFVGGAGRVLVHNETADERTEIILYLPAAQSAEPGTLRLLNATVCSAKPGIPATAGQPLLFHGSGARVVVTIPLLRLNDWMYIDLTWDGSFPVNGAVWPGGAIPLGKLHPQVAVEATLQTGQTAVAPVPARYDVTLGADPGTTVRVEGEGKVVTRMSEDGQTSEHEFKSYGTPQIQALLVPPGTIEPPADPTAGLTAQLPPPPSSPTGFR